MTTDELRIQRQEQNRKMQEEFNSLKTYQAKLEYIYNEIIIKTQFELLKYKNVKLEGIDQLIRKLNEIKDIDDNKFCDFVMENIILKINAGHLNIKANKEIESEELIHQREEYIKTHPEVLQSKKNIEYYFLNEQPETLIIRIKSFSKFNLENDKKIFEEIYYLLNNNDFENIVFDIRGNKGGTDEYFDFFSMFTSKTIYKTDMFRNLLTGENQTISWEAIKGIGREYNRYLLVDEFVFSTAESLAILCKQTGFAKIVGKPTMGEGYGATPFSLKITDKEYTGKYKKEGICEIGVVLTFPIEAPINIAGEIDYEFFYNTRPDIDCGNKDALLYTLNFIEQQKKEKSILK